MPRNPTERAIPLAKPLPAATCPHEVWILHALGPLDRSPYCVGNLRVVLVSDVFTRMCVAAGLPAQYRGHQARTLLARAMARHGAPAHLVVTFPFRELRGGPSVTRVTPTAAREFTCDVESAATQIWAPLKMCTQWDGLGLLLCRLTRWVADGLQQPQCRTRIDTQAQTVDAAPVEVAFSPMRWPEVRHDARYMPGGRRAQPPHDEAAEEAPCPEAGSRPSPRPTAKQDTGDSARPVGHS